MHLVFIYFFFTQWDPKQQLPKNSLDFFLLALSNDAQLFLGSYYNSKNGAKILGTG